ncbi:DUF2339 domain-containing protein [Paenibacillus sp. y28]|uniref:DUF2339 domain-containing protein n=1 Tax=Paenibacillus sp. y28 TaxID=3129110 RepID=UPI003015DF86
MKAFQDRLHAIQTSQRELAKQYEALVSEYDSHQLHQELEELQEQHERTKQALADLEQRFKVSNEQNAQLRYALKEQILDEKLSILKLSRQKLETYFGGTAHAEGNRLSRFEYDLRMQITQMGSRLSGLTQEQREQMQAKLGALTAELDEKLLWLKRQFAQEQLHVRHHMDLRQQELGEEEISEELIQKRMKQNQIEMKIGLNWLNKLGILLILFGVGAAFKYSYSTWFNGYMKGSLFFLLGLLLLGGGEWFYRRSKTTFALGLLGGGISVLYGSIFYSYFLLDLIPLLVGLALSVLVTAAAVLLSLRYQSRTVCAFGLVGSYLPFIAYTAAYGLDGGAVLAAMGYLLLLNISVLMVSFQKQWRSVQLISFILHLPCMLVLVMEALQPVIGMVYSVVVFLLYLAVTLGYPLRHRLRQSAGGEAAV